MSDSDSRFDRHIANFLRGVAAEQWPQISQSTSVQESPSNLPLDMVRDLVRVDDNGITFRREMDDVPMRAFNYQIADYGTDTGKRDMQVVMGYSPRNNKLIVYQLVEHCNAIRAFMSAYEPKPKADPSPSLGGKSGRTGDEPMLGGNRRELGEA